MSTQDKFANFSDNTLFNNTALYGNEFATYPVRLVLNSDLPSTYSDYKQYDTLCNYSARFPNSFDNKSDYRTYYDSMNCSQKFELLYEAPGIVMSSILRFKIVDQYNQTVVTQNGSLCFVEARSGEDYENLPGVVPPNLIGFTITTLINGISNDFMSINYKGIVS